NDRLKISVQFGLYGVIFVEFQEMSFFADFDQSGKAIPFPLFHFWPNFKFCLQYLISIQN
ncbi:hypothetical protein YC68_24500, partial [Vibrio parahaemolyticus]